METTHCHLLIAVAKELFKTQFLRLIQELATFVTKHKHLLLKLTIQCGKSPSGHCIV